MITPQEVLMGRDAQFPLTPELKTNLDKLLIALNKVRFHYGKPMQVSSGYRPAAINKTVKGAAPKSSHMTCEACDFRDPDGALAKWCLANLSILEDAGLYLENPEFTKGWVHLQTRKTRSGKRVFNP